VTSDDIASALITEAASPRSRRSEIPQRRTRTQHEGTEMVEMTPKEMPLDELDVFIGEWMMTPPFAPDPGGRRLVRLPTTGPRSVLGEPRQPAGGETREASPCRARVSAGQRAEASISRKRRALGRFVWGHSFEFGSCVLGDLGVKGFWSAVFVAQVRASSAN
jgi:hypothetical protein